ncbi:MAG: glycoside hydrolase family 3 protein [Spirochaetales bacterium]|nr:glycoside hydrolase family 3 protein [Spirochaetales bacterium]
MMKLKSEYARLIACAIIVSSLMLSCRPENPDAAAAGSDAGVEDPALALLSTLSVREKIGQLLFMDLWTDEGEPLTELTDSLKSDLEELAPGGVVFYGANLKNPEQVREFAASITELLRVPPFLAIDHEGGSVNRLDDSGQIKATDLPPAAAVGKTGDPELAHRIGLVMGRELSSLGLNMNFAPVADLVTSADSVIGSRSYGSDPALVADMVRMMVAGLQETGVCSVIKHFPGHGGSTGDTHAGAVFLDKNLDELFAYELVPFAAGVEAGADGIMAAHIILGAPGAGGAPATLSRDLLTGVLRQRLDFDGLIITDSLTMKALSEADGPAVQAILAGADVLLTPGDERAVSAQILTALQEGTLSAERIDESVLRIIRTKLKRGIGSKPAVTPEQATEALGSDLHRQVVSEIQRFHSSGE